MKPFFCFQTRLSKIITIVSLSILGFFAFIFILGFIFSFFDSDKDKVLNSLGEYETFEYYSEGFIQDYTDYAKYYYNDVSFIDNNYFSKIQESDLEKIDEHLNNFEEWIINFKDDNPSLEIVVNYDFNRAIIDTGDYFYIDSKKYTTTLDDGTTDTGLSSYDIYIFDSQTKILYYFHNNI